MRPFKARKCLHFCTFLLSHYAKYICIVCRCFSSSFDAYVLLSSVVFRFVSSPQAGPPSAKLLLYNFLVLGAHSDFGPDSLDVVVVESGLYCECVAVALALWLLASAFGYYAFMSCQVRFKTLQQQQLKSQKQQIPDFQHHISIVAAVAAASGAVAVARHTDCVCSFAYEVPTQQSKICATDALSGRMHRAKTVAYFAAQFMQLLNEACKRL